MPGSAATQEDGRGSPIRVFVPGIVKPWPRPIPVLKRHRGPISCSNKKGCRVKVVAGNSDKEWRKSIIARVGLLVGREAPWFQEDEALVVAARFNMQRPKIHYVANDRERPLRENAPKAGEMVGKPDTDNCLKSVCDALQGSTAFPDGLLYGDDQQVSIVLARKLWVGPRKKPGLDLVVCRASDISGDVMGWLLG